MTTRTMVFTALGLSIIILALAAAWKLMPGPEPADSVSAQQQDCIGTGLGMIDSGNTEIGWETLENCIQKNPALKLKIKNGKESATLHFEQLMTGWTPPWPDRNGKTSSELTDTQIAEKLNATEDFLVQFPSGYHSRLAVTLKALLLYHRGKYAACLRWLHENSDRTAVPAVSTYISALAAWKSGQDETALGFLRTIESEYPDSPMAARAALVTAVILKERGEVAASVEKARDAAALEELSPVDRGEALLYASQILLEAGDRTAHIRAVMDVAMAYPNADSEDFLEKYLDKEQDKLTDDQVLILARYFNAKDRGYPIVQMLSKLKTLPPEGTYLLARGQYLSNEYDKATSLLKKLDSGNISEELHAKSCMLTANIFEKKKKWDTALQQYGTCADKFASLRGEAYERSARIHLIRQDEARQASALEKLVAADPENKKAPEYLLLIARKYLIAGDSDKAEGFFHTIARNHTDSYPAAEALFWLGKLAFHRRDFESASAHFKDLMNRFPYSFFYMRSHDYLNVMGVKSADYRQFLSLCRSKYSVELEESGTLESANALRHLKIYGPAMEYFRLAEKNHPNESAVGISDILRNKGEITLSIKTIEERVKTDPYFYRDVLSSDYLTGLLFPLHFLGSIKTESAKYNMDPAWPISIIRQESRFKTDARSTSNALGLMQIIPSTGKWIAKNIGFKYPGNSGMYDSETNIKFGTWYFNHLLELEHIDGNPALALAAYNGGPGNVRKWIDAYGNDDIDMFIEKMPRAETRGYVKKVMLNYYAYDALINMN